MKKYIPQVFLIIATFLLIYTRFFNLSWGLPYPFHPDERNMAVALQGLKCENYEFWKQCFNPNFFAYGQLPLYLGYGLVVLYRFLIGALGVTITLPEAILALRIISAMASAATVGLVYNLVKRRIVMPLLIFSPVLIQLAHFGTTESLLTFFYTTIVVVCFRRFTDPPFHALPDGRPSGFTFYVSLLCGLAVATKASSVIFMGLPFLTILASLHPKGVRGILKESLIFIFLTALVSTIFSPHNFISFSESLSTIRYESEVGIGSVIPFYTRQFAGTTPVLFQALHVFPYALGWPVFAVFLWGFFSLSWKDVRINFLRLSFLLYFLPGAFIYAKWIRFMAPVFPLMIGFAGLGLLKIKNRLIMYILLLAMIIPGVAYLSIYHTADVRAKASEWIYRTIPEDSYILSETANVVDIPFQIQNYQIISFDFYGIDEDERLAAQFENHLSRADYIFVPSRRVFMNHPADKYPTLNKYYKDLFSGRLGFKQVAEFTSYPTLQISRFKFHLPDEAAEESWTVFDHPVIRIYKRI